MTWLANAWDLLRSKAWQLAMLLAAALVVVGGLWRRERRRRLGAEAWGRWQLAAYLAEERRGVRVDAARLRREEARATTMAERLRARGAAREAREEIAGAGDEALLAVFDRTYGGGR